MADNNHAEEAKEDSNQRGKGDDVNHSRQKPSVCRRLDFGSDHEKELNNLLSLSNEDLERHRHKAIDKWNFDFENEVPLDGDWQWEKVPVQPSEVKEVICTLEKERHENRTV
uniref:Cyclin-dependent kinase inhibitor n=1 Tax=Anoplophora glabripennis TaxID=217634 RepID=V5IAH7_ANOGL